MLSPKTMRERLEKRAFKLTKGDYDSFFAHMQEWKILEQKTEKLFVVAEVPDFGTLILECPNQAYANKFAKEFAKHWPNCVVSTDKTKGGKLSATVS